uniref:Uncharacterized protein n=1 Tax=Medicago truncatula TaxID=3880 RepID=A2Q275_MEDTR|nr:hypothetical protein MtrDRAFT_AC149490g18v2 [Medicago truncatula]
MFRKSQNQILSNFPEMSNRLRLNRNQTLMKLQNMLNLVSSHFKPTKLTRLGFFSDDVKSKDREELLEWARRQANKAEFTIVTQRSSLINQMFRLVCERSGAHKVPEKKPKHARTGSRKCGCLFMISGYQSKQTKE